MKDGYLDSEGKMKDYYLGLDIGTDSVGIACTDENYELLRKKGKDLWAVRLFDEAQTAVKRRTNRALRRRLARRKERIKLLQEIFAPFMTDDRFFIRLNNSAFYEEDKKDENGLSLDTKYSLFADENYRDKEFYNGVNKDDKNGFKTVFHLRRKMMENTDNKKDIRFYYLALHHIIKYRGHFLYDTDFDSNGSAGIRELFEKFNRVLDDCYTASTIDGEEDSDDLSSILRLDPEKAVDFQNIFLGVTDKNAAENIESVKDNKSENNAVESKTAETDVISSGNTEVKTRLTLTEKKNRLITLFDAKKIKQKEELLALLVGFKVKPSKFFGEKYKDNDESFSFKSTTEEDLEQKRDSFDEEDFAVLEAAREIYKYVQYKAIIGDHEFFSDAMICVYDKHKADLEKLKEFVKQNYDRKVYVDIFKKIEKPSEEKAEENDSDDDKKSKKTVLNNYVRYVGHAKVGNTKITVKKCKPDEFFAFLKKILKDEKNRKTDFDKGTCFDQKTCDEILSEIEDGEFLPKILHADKGNVPYQCNKIELDKILNNLCKDYPEFNERDLDGYTLKEKIEKIFTFKIPYYVGPLKSVDPNADAGKKPNYWMIRKEGKESETIKPWNFDEIVDKEKSNEQFMRRMTNKCTYLYAEDVLPKGSIYYQAFDVLNQINKLTFKGAPISVRQKQDIFNELYKKNKKVTVKDIENYFVLHEKATKDEVKGAFGGFDVKEGIKANMNSYVTFKNRFGDLVNERIDVFEKIILWHTLNTDKKMVADLVKRDYGDIFNAEDIKWIKGLTSFKEFGKLSKKFLHDETFAEDSFTSVRMTDGVANCTILSELYNTNYNLNQLINLDEYEFKTKLEEANSVKDTEEVTYEDVEALNVSPSVRRGIWQTLKMVDEYVSAIGYPPKKIFIEVTRKPDKDPKRTVSRKNKLLKLYAEAKDDLKGTCDNINELIAEINGKRDSDIRQERLYLYYLQCGRCAYTNEPISLEELSSDNYDVDHIIPRSKTKDDSLDNKVLVKRAKNQNKRDDYPLPKDLVTDSARKFWKVLKDKKFMSDKKYNLLTRTKPLDDDDLKDFVSRQLVTTNQSTKAVAELLSRKYGNETKIVYSKASNVNDFKSLFKIVKCRETNDLHHARDAYLNIVVGNVYATRFSDARDYYTKGRGDAYWKKVNLDRLFNKIIIGAWNGVSDINRVKYIAQKHSMAVTRFSYKYNGKFYKETIFRKDDKSVSYPRKDCYPYNIKDSNGLYKYGGYSQVQNAYFVALEHSVKKKRVKVILGLPVMEEYKIKGDETKIKRYFEEEQGLKDVKILCKEIKKDTLISYNGYKCYITGASDNRIILSNAVQWFSNQEQDLYVKNIFKLLQMESKNILKKEDYDKTEFKMSTNRLKKNEIIINAENNKKLYEDLLKQLSNEKIYPFAAFETLKSILEKKTETNEKDIEEQEKEYIFSTKTILEQAHVLGNIVTYLRRGDSNGLDLRLLSSIKKACPLRVGYNITNVDFRIIHQSPCGLTERVQKI